MSDSPDRTLFLHAPRGAFGPSARIGGMPLVERLVREGAKAGAARAVCACDPVPIAALAVPVEWVAADTSLPPGADVRPADEIRGVRVTDEPSRRAAEWQVVLGLNKSFQGPVDATINWRMSYRITRLLSGTPVHPNQVTLVALAVGLAAIGLAAAGGAVALVAAGLLMEFQSVLDSVDGEMARLQYKGSVLGQWLDNVCDDVIDDLFPAAAGIGTGQWEWAVIGVAGTLLRGAQQLYTYVTVYRATGTGNLYTFRWWFEADKATSDDVYDPRSAITWVRSLGRRDTYVFVWMAFC
ncbi:MAG: CDP-alcohol phosphatidyltransferase family protein, partial [Deltaproteobacteria bacterium]|nr:CDP-alcohol phosphatidyltransferase family protein [Deltaproteobacteria bacterium]